MNYYNDQYLAHYGVLGMKWGVRKQRKELKAMGIPVFEYEKFGQ